MRRSSSARRAGSGAGYTAPAPPLWTRKLDAVFLHPVAGPLIFVAVVHRYGTLGHEPRPLFDLLLRYAVSEDGALHAEKYYRTVSDEFTVMRPAFRWRQLIALARVTASEYGQAAPGFAEACKLLGV